MGVPDDQRFEPVLHAGMIAEVCEPTHRSSLEGFVTEYVKACRGPAGGPVRHASQVAFGVRR